MANHNKKSLFSIERIFVVIIIVFAAVIIFSLFGNSDKVDELKMDSSTHPHVFSYSPDGENIWLGTHMGVYEYKAGKWLRTVKALSNDDIMGLEIDPNNPDTVFVSGHGFVKQSQDGGDSWKAIENGLPNKPKPDAPDAHYLTMDVNDPKRLITMLAHQQDNVFETKDGGESWTKLGTLPPTVYSIAFAPDNDTSLIAAAENGLFRYDFNYESLSATQISDKPAYQLVALPNGTVIVMGNEGFIQSTDIKTWTPMSINLNGETPLGIKASKKDPERLVIVTESLSVYESRNGGIDWEKI